ncbi:uncharacterized protein LOC134273182 [Saccostrea cucullata]|uniref:uncharacterized protein LOC134273182 n=1 Tax=Saccostrea cuccullata TaxID=36930 RepID=UPI002ED5CD69
MKSIHQYGSDKAPVILVGTHSENKTEKEKELFFREVWKTLDMKKKSLKKHIDVKRRFAIGFHDNESLEKLKMSIADVVCKLDHWGEELPQSWAMFETFFQEKKIRKILSRGELQSFNETLTEGIKLHTIEDMDAMLQFFHDIRELIHFNHQFLNEVIILDVQWFADAFRNVITDKNHAQEDLFDFASEWDKFNETGELDKALLCAIWRMNNNGYLEHKENIMMYMEKLGLLAKMSDKTWYVPCMNKMQFPVDCFSSYPASTILCYTFDILPVEIFHRLVATCMQIPWEIFSDEERGCIYQTVAVFVFHDQRHNVLMGMTQTEIQLQVFVTDEEGEVDISACHEIREKIESILNNLADTFQNNSGFHVAFKCKPAGFCDSKESSVINESKFTRATFQCPSCPASKKHPINTNDITKYWKKELQKKPDPKEENISALELILNVVSKKMRDTTCCLLASYFEVAEDIFIRNFEEQVFRILYKWLCKNPNIDHLNELERILNEADQGRAAEYVRTFNMADFQCRDIPSPSLSVSEKEFHILSQYLPKDYTHFVRLLGLRQRSLEKIEENFQKIEKRVYEALLQTREECPTLCRQDLCRALTFLERNDVIEALKPLWKS